MDHSTMDHAAMGHDMSAMTDVAAAAGGFDYTLAFIAGFLGSGHCLGMCGALVSGYFINLGKQRSYLPYLGYQLARISVYTSVGLLAAALGVVLVSSGLFGKIQGGLQMLLGFTVIILALGILGWLPLQGSIRLIPTQLWRKGYASSRTKGPVLGSLIAGFLNGLMPCPLTFAMFVKAASAPTIIEGGALMLTFGAGTLPMMLFISLAFGKISAHIRGLMFKAAAAVMLYMGGNTLYRGLTFYFDEDFKHHNYYLMLQEKLDQLVAYLTRVIDYFSDLVGHIQNM